MKHSHKDNEAALARLREVLHPGSKVYTVERSKGVTYRYIQVFVIEKEELSDISWQVAVILDFRANNKHPGVKTGLGQSQLIGYLSSKLFGGDTTALKMKIM